MQSTYDPAALEQSCYKNWEEQGYFKPSGDGAPYCIMLPPPNVTGTLHMGHGFQQTLMDALIRYHRMQGNNTLWQAGTDHAGIATQMVVERLLLQEGKSRLEVGRTAFLERMWQWKNQSDGTIKKQMRRLGTSVDWTRERFTLDDSISRAVIKVFIDLHQQGLIYRGKRLVNWDPALLTAVSDLEVISEEQQGQLWHIRYPVENSDEFIIVATTRPETLLGDVAVAVHPDDERYQLLIGKNVQLPLTDRLIPIIADPMVDKEFGSGAVKITPAHDFNDNAMAQRHNLPLINIFTPNAHLNENAPKKYQGLERFQARAIILEDLKQLKLLEKIEAHVLKIPKGDRSGAVIEPYLTDQWFMTMKPLAETALAAVKKGEIKFIPEHWNKIYFQWLENIQDWCISRQLWWGHRIPAWHDENNQIYVGLDEADVRKKYNLANNVKLKQDDDVLDTWFSSALWPFATLGWPDHTTELANFYPTSVLVTGFDIIFFWVARMIMLGLHFTGKVPFHEVYITGLIRDAEGQKMSKTKGNILDPIDLIDGISIDALIKKRTQGLMQPQMAKRIETNTRKEFPEGISAFGTDALRFTFCALASPGREIRFDLGRLEGYRNFCNKIWNATRYVLMNIEGKDFHVTVPAKTDLSLPDRWIRTRLQEVIQNVHEHFKHYRFDLMTQAIYEFVWNDYCDWYLEFSKPILMGENYSAAEKNATRYTLLEILETVLRLTHPIMPFITESLWQTVAPLLNIKGATIMLQAYPQAEPQQIDVEAVADLTWLQKMILAVRNIRGEMVIAPKKHISLILRKASDQDRQRLQKNSNLLKTLAKIEMITEQSMEEPLPLTATALIDDLELHIPLADLIDKSAEQARLEKEIAKQDKDYQSLKGRLDNPNFVNKAPADVVQKEQQRLIEIAVALEKLRQQLQRLAAL